MSKALTVGRAVDQISGWLGNCSPKAIASLIAVSEADLTHVHKQSLGEAERGVGDRLTSLLYVLDSLKDERLTAATTFKVLVTPCMPQKDGSYLDVASAIQMGTVSNSELGKIADAALERLR